MKKRSILSTAANKVASVAMFTPLLIALIFASGCAEGENFPGFGSATAAGVGVGTGTGSGPSPVLLGTSANYIILAQTAITNVPASDVTGTVGLHPATGAGIHLTCPEVTGQIHSTNAAGPACRIISSTALNNAVNDKGTAYTDATGRPADYTELGAGLLGGKNLGPAVYRFGTGVNITSDLMLSGGPDDVWIFQIAQGLSLASGVQVKLSGGARAENVYWAVVAAADLGTTSVMKGTIISTTTVVLKTGATLNGRALAGTGVTLQSATVGF